ncbi:1534_t:CDS:10 [Acaulospora colombiana]|uniref:1534_t:CDS:1 n=1 Tax=Acaulospora colombiana TaxID=27376 RepID=A0ACA9L3D6_9GLOM|nr:1534_t:CDS:10 [Acaulospora colombiana]
MWSVLLVDGAVEGFDRAPQCSARSKFDANRSGHGGWTLPSSDLSEQDTLIGEQVAGRVLTAMDPRVLIRAFACREQDEIIMGGITRLAFDRHAPPRQLAIMHNPHHNDYFTSTSSSTTTQNRKPLWCHNKADPLDHQGESTLTHRPIPCITNCHQPTNALLRLVLVWGLCTSSRTRFKPITECTMQVLDRVPSRTGYMRKRTFATREEKWFTEYIEILRDLLFFGTSGGIMVHPFDMSSVTLLLVSPRGPIRPIGLCSRYLSQRFCSLVSAGMLRPARHSRLECLDALTWFTPQRLSYLWVQVGARAHSYLDPDGNLLRVTPKASTYMRRTYVMEVHLRLGNSYSSSCQLFVLPFKKKDGFTLIPSVMHVIADALAAVCRGRTVYNPHSTPSLSRYQPQVYHTTGYSSVSDIFCSIRTAWHLS